MTYRITGKSTSPAALINCEKVCVLIPYFCSAEEITVGKEVKGKVHTFYQTLIDFRDCPFIVSFHAPSKNTIHCVVFYFVKTRFEFQRAQTEAVTFLGSQESSRSLYAIPGLDYVAHEDILPYTTTEKQPLQHELFDKFLTYCPDKGLLKCFV